VLNSKQTVVKLLTGAPGRSDAIVKHFGATPVDAVSVVDQTAPVTVLEDTSEDVIQNDRDRARESGSA
jgi:hypothetical protein